MLYHHIKKNQDDQKNKKKIIMATLSIKSAADSQNLGDGN